MTREKLVDILFESIDGVPREVLRTCADRILSALDAEIPAKANAVMIYCLNCLQDGTPFERAEIEKILREAK